MPNTNLLEEKNVAISMKQRYLTEATQKNSRVETYEKVITMLQSFEEIYKDKFKISYKSQLQPGWGHRITAYYNYRSRIELRFSVNVGTYYDQVSGNIRLARLSGKTRRVRSWWIWNFCRETKERKSADEQLTSIIKTFNIAIGLINAIQRKKLLSFEEKEKIPNTF